MHMLQMYVSFVAFRVDDIDDFWPSGRFIAFQYISRFLP